jgi:hypothetical protein
LSPCRLSTTLVGVSIGIALLSLLMSLLGLVDSRVYAEETENWTLQAQGQDIGNLFTAAALVLTALRSRGARRPTRCGSGPCCTSSTPTSSTPWRST